MKSIKVLVALLSVVLILRDVSSIYAQETATQDQAPPPIPAAQLDSLVAPVALYPDPLLSQLLVASTYPIEVVQLQQWLAQNPNLKDQALADAVQKQDWDPSIQAMSAFPAVVKQLADNIKWTTDLGNAFIDHEGDVMDAVQRMRAKAAAAGNLKSTQQQTVETKVVETKTVVVIQPATPQVVYVPVYNPLVVFGPPIYPYPAIYYPPPGYFAGGMAISFGSGVSIGVWGGGGWGWGFGWGQRNVIINVNNRYIYNRNRNFPGRSYQPGPWRHDPRHRGGVPYRDRGGRRGGPPPARPGTPRPNPGKPGTPNPRPPDRPSVRPQPSKPQPGKPQPGKPSDRPSIQPVPGKPSDRPSDRPQPGRPDHGAGRPQPGKPDGPRIQPVPDKPADRPSNRPDRGAGRQQNRDSNGRTRAGGGDRIGNREVPKEEAPRKSGAFDGAGKADRATEGANSKRGAASAGESRGGRTRR